MPMEVVFLLPMFLYIAAFIYIVSLLQRIAVAVERVAVNTARPSIPNEGSPGQEMP